MELGGDGEHLSVCKSPLLHTAVMSTVCCYCLLSFSHCFFSSKLLSQPIISAFLSLSHWRGLGRREAAVWF